MTESEEISRDVYDRKVEPAIRTFLQQRNWRERILCIVTTAGTPLKISGTSGEGGEQAAVDSELALLYQDLARGREHTRSGSLPNPYFGARDQFSHPQFPMYMVVRLAGYTFNDVKNMIDRSMAARNRGVAVLDTRGELTNTGDTWLIAAAARLPKDRVVLDDTSQVLSGFGDVIAYAGWGSNDKRRKERNPGFRFLPGAVVTEFVSTNARTMAEPGADWTLGSWTKPWTFFAGTPQSLAADYIRFGATAVTGHVFEPYLRFCPRPEILLPAYLEDGVSVAEAFYRSIPVLSWQNVLLADPLTMLGRP